MVAANTFSGAGKLYKLKPPVDVWPVITVVTVGCVAAVWSMGRNLLVNPEVCVSKKYREGDSLWDDKEILSKADNFKPFPYLLRMIGKLGKASTVDGKWSNEW